MQQDHGRRPFTPGVEHLQPFPPRSPVGRARHQHHDSTENSEAPSIGEEAHGPKCTTPGGCKLGGIGSAVGYPPERLWETCPDETHLKT